MGGHLQRRLQKGQTNRRGASTRHESHHSFATVSLNALTRATGSTAVVVIIAVVVVVVKAGVLFLCVGFDLFLTCI